MIPVPVRRHARHTLIGVCTLLTLVAAAAPARAQLGLGLVPMRAELKMTPGQQYTGTLKLSSEAVERVRVGAEALDFEIDDTATPQFERNLPQEAHNSCKEWLSLNPVESEIEAQGFLMMRYTVRLPAEMVEGSYSCAVGFTTLPSAGAASDGIGMRMAVRIVATLYIQVGAPPITGAVKNLTIEPVPGAEASKDRWQAVVVLANTGLMYFRPAGTLEVLDESGTTVETAQFASLPVLRQRDQRFIFPLKTQFSTGHFTLRARVDIGTGEIQQRSADVVMDAAAPVPR
jgi:hypothetical protein